MPTAQDILSRGKGCRAPNGSDRRQCVLTTAIMLTDGSLHLAVKPAHRCWRWQLCFASVTQHRAQYVPTLKIVPQVRQLLTTRSRAIGRHAVDPAWFRGDSWHGGAGSTQKRPPRLVASGWLLRPQSRVGAGTERAIVQTNGAHSGLVSVWRQIRALCGSRTAVLEHLISVMR